MKTKDTAINAES